jgi:hypothetical protein
MRVRHLAWSMLLLAGAAGAHAQQASKETSPPATAQSDCRGTAAEIRACGEAWFKDCLKDWDSATHMSKKDYARTCKRVAENRVKALIDQVRKQEAGKQTSAGQ